jgi:hypothetical protein
VSGSFEERTRVTTGLFSAPVALNCVTGCRCNLLQVQHLIESAKVSAVYLAIEQRNAEWEKRHA